MSGGAGAVYSSANASGGAGGAGGANGFTPGDGGAGGAANARSTATSGSGNASSYANASGGAGGNRRRVSPCGGAGGNADADQRSNLWRFGECDIVGANGERGRHRVPGFHRRRQWRRWRPSRRQQQRNFQRLRGCGFIRVAHRWIGWGSGPPRWRGRSRRRRDRNEPGEDGGRWERGDVERGSERGRRRRDELWWRRRRRRRKQHGKLWRLRPRNIIGECFGRRRWLRRQQ